MNMMESSAKAVSYMVGRHTEDLRVFPDIPSAISFQWRIDQEENFHPLDSLHPCAHTTRLPSPYDMCPQMHWNLIFFPPPLNGICHTHISQRPLLHTENTPCLYWIISVACHAIEIPDLSAIIGGFEHWTGSEGNAPSSVTHLAAGEAPRTTVAII